MKNKILSFINVIFNIAPWTLMLIRTVFDWATKSPMDKNLIVGYCISMVVGGLFAILSSMVMDNKKPWQHASIVINIIYLFVAAAFLFVLYK